MGYFGGASYAASFWSLLFGPEGMRRSKVHDAAGASLDRVFVCISPFLYQLTPFCFLFFACIYPFGFIFQSQRELWRGLRGC